MDEQFKKLTRILRLEYGLFIILPILIVSLFESDCFPAGYYADDFRMQYILGTIGILLTLTFVPVSLKLFSFKLIQKVKEAPIHIALKKYKMYYTIRLTMLASVVLTNIVFYYLVLQNIGVLCAIIGFIASIFCIPSESRIRQELDID